MFTQHQDKMIIYFLKHAMTMSQVPEETDQLFKMTKEELIEEIRLLRSKHADAKVSKRR